MLYLEPHCGLHRQKATRTRKLRNSYRLSCEDAHASRGTCFQHGQGQREMSADRAGIVQTFRRFAAASNSMHMHVRAPGRPSPLPREPCDWCGRSSWATLVPTHVPCARCEWCGRSQVGSCAQSLSTVTNVSKQRDNSKHGNIMALTAPALKEVEKGCVSMSPCPAFPRAHQVVTSAYGGPTSQNLQLLRAHLTS